MPASYQRPNIEAMQGYSPGEQPQEAGVIKLNTNENPYPPSPAVAAELEAISADSLRRYPPPLATGFRQQAAALHGVEPANIIATNGGDELLRLALTTFVDAGETVVTTSPSYSLYPVLAAIQGCPLEQIPLAPDWSMPADFLARLQALRARMCILVNPHAPTGKLLTADYLAQLAAEFDGILLIDEAYVDFVDPDLRHDTLPLVASHDNVLLLRTLSKGYSLAGLRFGYGIAAPGLISPMLYKTRDSYNTDYLSQRLATAALASVDYARDTWYRVRQARQQLRQALAGLGLPTGDSQTNFLLSQVPAPLEAGRLYEQLKQRGILVRYFHQEGLQDKLRISVGNPRENQALLAALTDILAS